MVWRVLVLGAATLVCGAAEDPWDKVLLLQKVKRHVAEAVKQLPDYTCLQTSARYRKRAEKDPERLVDTVVLEVLNSDSKELFASPGDRSFQAESPMAFTGHGLAATGAFALFLRTLFVNDNGQFQWVGEEEFRARKALKWNYRVPLTSSGYEVTLEFSRGRVAMRGYMLVDAETMDLIRLVVDVDDIPPNLPLVSATQTIDYAPTRIGDRDVVLPQSGTMALVEETGASSRNEVAFTHCQSFRVESTLSFTATDAGPATASRPPEPVRPIAAGLVVAVELVAPVTERHTVGGLIEGRVVADARERGRTAIPAGSAVRGRIRRLERDGDYWIVGLEFTEIETVSGPARFYANIQELDKASGATFFLKTKMKDRTEEQSLGYLPGVAHFYAPKLPLATGFKTVWKTTSPRSATR
jgi:hypothetical protein